MNMSSQHLLVLHGIFYQFLLQVLVLRDSLILRVISVIIAAAPKMLQLFRSL